LTERVHSRTIAGMCRRLLLVVLLMVAALTACGGGGDKDTSATATTAQATRTTAASTAGKVKDPCAAFTPEEVSAAVNLSPLTERKLSDHQDGADNLFHCYYAHDFGNGLVGGVLIELCLPALSNHLLCNGRIATDASKLNSGDTRIDVPGASLAFEHAIKRHTTVTAVFPGRAVIVNLGLPVLTDSIEPYRAGVRALLITATQRLG
jgi:hypothetical protein